MIESERIKKLNSMEASNRDFIIYWMQQSQRTHFNHALYYAIQMANDHKQPLIVYFGLTDNYPEANLRHYRFLLEGLHEVSKELKQMGIFFILRKEDPKKGIGNISDEARMIIVDRGYNRIQREWRNDAASAIDCPLIQVESDVVVPVETASNKEEYGAYTIRPKIKRHIPVFLHKIHQLKLENKSLSYDFKTLIGTPIDDIIKGLSIDTSIKPSFFYKGGYTEATKVLQDFIDHKIQSFTDKRNDPSEHICSHLSSYLHFGQISPIQIALEVNDVKNNLAQSFLEELIIRRELSMNFVYYNNQYDSIECLPDWAYDSLMKHKKDTREYSYSLSELEKADTHDPYWNAAQKEMAFTGKMHGYMRMYWGKKILEWTSSPSKAFKIALYLNNKYELDGRDPNGYAGVAWCFGKHDRAWKERPIFGKIRYMSSNGLKKKGDMDRYIKRIQEIEERYFNT